MLAIDPDRFAAVHGSTDTEVVFQLALTFGLEDDPIAAIEQTVGLIEATERFAQLSDDDRLVVSEPFSDLPGVWREIPEATAVTVGPGGLFEERPFTPSAPA